MAKVLVAKRKKKSSSSSKDKTSKLTIDKRTEVNVKATNSNIFEMENLLTENREESLEIFHQKGMKKSSLPSISSLLLSSTKDSGFSSLLNDSTEKPQQPIIQKYARSEDIFITKVASSTFNTSKHFNDNISSPLDKNHKRSRDYSISAMFSDGLSQNDNSGLGFNYASSPDNSQTNPSLSAINMDATKVRDSLQKKPQGQKKEEIRKNLRQNEGSLRPESCEPKSNSLLKTFERNKQRKETLNSCGVANSSGSDKKLGTFSQKAEKSSSRTCVTSGKRDLGITSSLRDSIGKLRAPEIADYDNNKKPCIVCEEKTQMLSPVYRIDKRSKACFKPDDFDVGNSPGEIIADVDLDNSESHSINIILSDCNLDHSINSEDCDDKSIKMISERAKWYMDEASVSTGIDHNEDENLQLTGLMLNFNENDSIIEFGKADNASQNSFHPSHSLVELLDIGSQLSDRSNLSLTPYSQEFDLSQNCKTSFEERNPIRQEIKPSSFNIPQSLYIRQRSSFFKRKETENRKAATSKLYGSTGARNEQFTQDIHWPIYRNEHHTSGYECSDGNKENERSIFDSEEQCVGHKDFGLEFINPSAKKFASSNPAKRSMKRRYPIDQNSEFFNVELNDACNMCEKKKQAGQDVGIVPDTGSRDRSISIDQSSCSSFNGADVSGKTGMKCFPSNRFWSISHQVQNFVKGWLDTDDEIYHEISSCSTDRKELLPNGRQLGADIRGREKRVDIDPEMLLSNYSCEYDKPYTIERFKPNVKLI